jgi:hypothetical protein
VVGRLVAATRPTTWDFSETQRENDQELAAPRYPIAGQLINRPPSIHDSHWQGKRDLATPHLIEN